MAQLVEFKPATGARDSCIAILRAALEQAEAGEVLDVAVVMALSTPDGPRFEARYHGDSAYAVLCTGVSALAFDLQYRRVTGDE